MNDTTGTLPAGGRCTSRRGRPPSDTAEDIQLRAWCPTCACESMPDDRGLCVWCDTAIADLTPPAPARVIAPPRGVFSMLTDELLEEARRLYYIERRSLRAIARELHPRTGYASPNSLVMGLIAQFDAQGWPRRDRIAECVAVSTKHGLARRGAKDPELRAKQRRDRGEVRGVMCAGVRVGYPRKGAPCGRAALAGGDYCAAHDPGRRRQVLEGLMAARARVGRAA